MRLVTSDRRGGGIFFVTDTCNPLYGPLRDLVRAASWVDGDDSLQPLDWLMRYELRPDEYIHPRIRTARHRYSL
jgi:hypothetical protein